MRSSAELRGPIHPFRADAKGEIVYFESKLEEILKMKGFIVRDNRTDIKPLVVAHIKPSQSSLEP